MKTQLLPILIGSLLALAHGEGTQNPIAPTIESVAMFKNGVAIVHAGFEASEPGDYVWIDPPRAVHGAFFVESAPGLTIRSTTRWMKPEETPLPTGNLQRDLAGAGVCVSLPGENGKTWVEISGKVQAPPVPEHANWNTDYTTTRSRHSWSYYSSSVLPQNRQNPVPAGNWLVIDQDGKRQFVATSRIGVIRVDRETTESAKELRPVMVFSVKNPGKVRLTWLTKGMAWMPAYQIDLLTEKRLRLRQTAVVRNELMGLKKTELELISGYPNIQFAHVGSLLTPEATLAAFFQQISQDGGAARGGPMTQQIAFNMVGNSFSNNSMPLPQPDAGAPAEDLHYECIGAHDLKEGDALSLEVAAAEADCERIVEWKVPDYRDGNGRIRRDNDQAKSDEPWDAVQFKNPLGFPMTTGAASVLQNRRFLGQSMTMWTAPGQDVSVRINKALTVRGEHTEIEEEGKRQIVYIGGNDYQRTTVKGTLKVTNTRADPVKLVIRTDFSGKLLAADGEPEKSLRVSGVSSVNPRRRLEWTFQLKNGESKTLEYRYSVLVDR